MDSLLGDAAKNIDLRFVSAKEAGLENATATDSDGTAAFFNSGFGKSLGARPMQLHMNTAALENKTSALEIIKGFANSLGPYLVDYV